MIKRLFLSGLLCLFSILCTPCFGQDCPEPSEDETAEDYSDMYPYCEDIDSPLDDGVPILIIAGVVISFVLKKHLAAKCNFKSIGE